MDNSLKHIPDSLEQWLQDPAALPIGPRSEDLACPTDGTGVPKLDIVDAVNTHIQKFPGEPLPKDFFMAHMARVLNQPRSLDAIKDQDK